jgi:transketolase C-terminal domain/subunit
VSTYGRQVHDALSVASELSSEGIDVELVDLRCLVLLDRDAMLTSERGTRRAVVYHEAVFTGVSEQRSQRKSRRRVRRSSVASGASGGRGQSPSLCELTGAPSASPAGRQALRVCVGAASRPAG